MSSSSVDFTNFSNILFPKADDEGKPIANIGKETSRFESTLSIPPPYLFSISLIASVSVYFAPF